MVTAMILDVDTGIDDACALLYALRSPLVDLRAVTCVDGNTSLDRVVANTGIVLDACGATDIPLAAGARRPLLAHPLDAGHVHGDDGMGDLGLAPSARAVDSRHAVELLRDLLLEAAAEGRPITVVPLAPLTNIALLLRTYPEVAAGIERIVVMGGSAGGGNVTATAEFNIFHDPEAAAIVVEASAELGIDLAMYGLDVFYRPVITRAEATDLLAGAEVGGSQELAGRLIHAQLDRLGPRAEGASIGDAGAVIVAAEPELATGQRLDVHVELAPGRSRGQTVVDQRGWEVDRDDDPQGRTDTSAEVYLDLDAAAVTQRWLEAVRDS